MTELIFKLLDLLLGGLVSKYKDCTQLQGKLTEHKNRVRFVGIVNNYPVELNRLRMFLIESNLVERPHVAPFFVKWLMHPIVVMGRPVVNLYSDEQIQELQADLESLKL